MTAQELRQYLNRTYGFNPWPEIFEVDAETYGNICQSLFDKWLERDFPPDRAEVSLGPNGGIMFKGIELILKGRL
jgi:hypothetical protein